MGSCMPIEIDALLGCVADARGCALGHRCFAAVVCQAMAGRPWLGLLASVPGLSNVPGFRAGRRVVRPAARAGRIARVIFQDDGLVLAEGGV